jgi:elongator complex protein 1
MRNISIVQDQVLSLDLHNGRIVSIAANHTNHRLYALTSTGVVATYDISDGIKILAQTQLFFENTQETWFAIDFLMVGSTLVALSREGSIVTADENGESQSGELENLDQIGVIDGGIRAASWSPDYSSLTIVTGNNTLLLMSNTWEPISEIDLPPITPGSSLEVSWKGDGELLSITSQDAADQCYYARIYTKALQLHAVGRNVADGPAGILKGVGSSIAFAPNGTLVAIYQRKAAELPQVAFLEKNGLRHGDFDLRKPPLPNDLTVGDWDVSHLAWDMTSTVMAVSWSAPIVSQSNSPSSTWGCIQLYYRENYYWYLKQQWTGPNMAFLTFDNEVHGRLYISQSADTASSLRIVDTFWKISSSPCRDGTVSVTDGVTQHFTPLGYNNVPPPMSMFQEKWSNNQLAAQACARNVTFWPFPVGSTQEKSNSASKFLWGAAFLLNEDGLVAFVLGDQRGKISPAGYLRIPNHQLCALREIAMLDLSSSPSVDIQKEKLALVAIGSPVQQVSSDPKSKVHHHDDVMMVLHIDVTTLVQAVARSNAAEPIDFSHYYAIAQLPGSIYAMTSIVGEEHALAVGIKHKETGSFDVHRLDFAAAFIELTGIEALPEHASLDFCDFPTELLLTIPEVCPHLYVLVNSKNSSSYYSHTVISLSLRNRLYVGEVLLVPGASSFAFNHAFNMLMFITVGTKPMLHFVTYGTLLKINPLMGEDQQELFEAAEPRPVERGAKLVASIENDSKIIIQLPRGNLETFEPRPLIILRAQQLINQCKLTDCLILLRLQRIDLNYLVDFDPTIFFEELERFIPQAIEKKADLLSLFITSLEPVDVTVTKYQLFDESSAENRTRRRMFVDKSQFLDKTKINVTCERLRAGLQTYLQQLQSQEKQLTAQQNSTVTNAILCTFAKQQPPLLVDALHFIQSHHQLNKSMQQASIKYLVFLVDGTQLFDAAVGDCVFDLARAVARQCQMDPKVYLPLLEKFESIGRGHAKNSLPFTLMHLNVQHHLSRAWETVEDFVSLLRLLYQSETSGDSVSIVSQEQVETALQLAEEMMLSSTVSSSSGANSNPPQSELMVKLLPQLVQLEQLMEEELLVTSAQSKFNSISVAKRFITSTRKHYAQHCLQQMQYHMAIASFLACYPPLPQRAIDSASAAGDWQQAIFLANRFHQASSSAVVAPMKLIQDIVSNFKQNQDTVSTSQSLEMTALTVTQAITSAESVSVLKSALASSNSSIVGNKEGAEENRAVTAARLCVEYLQDVESAVTILVTAQQWTLAMDYAGRFQRRDLYDEVKLNGDSCH